ncbi:MAG: hypothetical protein Ta2D_08130 [Rickettsiales bacterium]|nr:MAG: hypothetical protein Ta2D_08130 [Rickettsiales bacterium]
MDNVFCEERFLKEVKEIIKKFEPDATILLYGSRVNYTENNVHEGSDLDISLKNCKNNISQIRTAFSESNIPFLIDINVYKDMPISFQQEIDKNFVILV